MNMKELDFDDLAMLRMLEGVNLLADAAALTLGPRGRHVVIEQPGGSPEVTRDGATVAAAVSPPDPVARLGAELLRDAAQRTDDEVGDGTTTTIVLARAMIVEGLKSVAVGVSPVALRTGIERAVAAADAALCEMSWPCVEPAAIERIASVSAAGDVGLGRLLAEAIKRTGRDGTVLVEEGRSINDELEFVDGARIDSGYLSRSFITDAERDVCVLERPLILFVDGRLSSVSEVLKAMEHARELARPLLLVATDIEAQALATLAANASQGVLRCCALRAPGVGDDRSALLQDLAILCGAQVCSVESGISSAEPPGECFGQAERVEIDARRCVIVGGDGDDAALISRIGELRRMREAADERIERDQFERRLTRLAGGLAIVRVGAASETAMRARRAQADDALRAVRAALESGLVPGGGSALLTCRKALRALIDEDDDTSAGMRLVLRALEEPLRCIAGNAGAHPPVIVDAVRAGCARSGFDAQSGNCVDVVAQGIVDPLSVTRSALRNAASVAALMLGSRCTVTRAVPAQRVQTCGSAQ